MNISNIFQDNQVIATLVIATLLFMIIFYFVRKSQKSGDLPANEEGEFPPFVKKKKNMLPKNQPGCVYTRRPTPTKLAMIKTFRRMGIRGK